MTALFLGLLFASTAIYLVAALVLSWSRRADCARAPRDFTPPVSIIKPLSGLDDELEENLESFYRLDYPFYEVVFSFASNEDPALRVARRVADRHSGVPTVFVVDRREPAANSKVNRLAAGSRRARYRHLLFSDGNVRVREDFLRRAVAPFRDRSVGLVSNLFRGSWAQTIGSRVECLYLNGTLQPGTAAIARLLKQPCVVGKSILISRDALEAIGGFGAVGDYLAEDYLFGIEVRKAGYRVVLSADALDTTEIRKPPSAAWARHRRWAIIRRRVGGASYLAEILASPIPFYAGALFSAAHPAVPAIATGLLGIRYVIEAVAERDAGRPLAAADLPLLLLRDLAVAVLFWVGLTARTTAWRGRRLTIGRRSLIQVETSAPARILSPATNSR
jgi:ceramide glucosyltransferase